VPLFRDGLHGCSHVIIALGLLGKFGFLYQLTFIHGRSRGRATGGKDACERSSERGDRFLPKPTPQAAAAAAAVATAAAATPAPESAAAVAAAVAAAGQVSRVENEESRRLRSREGPV